MVVLRILSSSMTLSILLSIARWLVSSFFTNAFVRDHVWHPYLIAGKTHWLKTFLFKLRGRCLSRKISPVQTLYTNDNNYQQKNRILTVPVPDVFLTVYPRHHQSVSNTQAHLTMEQYIASRLWWVGQLCSRYFSVIAAVPQGHTTQWPTWSLVNMGCLSLQWPVLSLSHLLVFSRKGVVCICQL